MYKLYFSESCPGKSFNSEQECFAYEKKLQENFKRWEENSAQTKLEKLKYEFEIAMYVSPDTYATCSHDCIRIKNLIRVCQKFAEENKQYLNYY